MHKLCDICGKPIKPKFSICYVCMRDNKKQLGTWREPDGRVELKVVEISAHLRKTTEE